MTSQSGLKEAALIEYLDECSEMLDRFSKNLALIESAAANPDTLAAIYRDMHTIKGSSQLFGFSQVGQLAHAMETCLDPVRKGQMQASHALVDTLYAGSDIIVTLLAGIKENKKEPDLRQEISALIPRLIEITETSATATTSVTKDKAPTNDSTSSLINVQQASPAPIKSLQNAATIASISKLKTSTSATQAPKKAVNNPGFGFFDDAEIEASKETPTPPIPIVKAADAVMAKMSSEDVQSETIRVHVSLLDNLMNLVGELVLIRNQLLQYAKVNDGDAEFGKMSQRLNILTAELQNEVMKTRMQPVGNVLNKFTRVVRDMGRELGKKIEVNIQGAETELDKTIIEAVKDPLTHIIRNSVDHGVESTADRKAAGKDETGRITIKAYHESGQVIIEISDDGRGLERQRIGNKAIEKSLITSEALAKMTDRDVQFLIFAPGFSTAGAVSNISGRGVGMDVVKTNVERIGGLVDLSSIPGKGTCIKLKIPLTLAIVPALIVKAMDQRFAIPQSKLAELVRIDPSEDSNEKIETLQGSLVLRLRGKILPLLELSEVLTKPGNKKPTSNFSINSSACANIVILNADTFQFGLIVDAIEDTADIVVKALSSFLKELSHFSGATIMGDGSVALTIDVMGISESARSTSEDEAPKLLGNELAQKPRSMYQMDTAEFLLVDVGAPGCYAIPLTVVSRLEEFDPKDFELSGEQQVVRYRESLLPIFSLPEFLHLPFERGNEVNEKASVVVIRRGDNLYGIKVEQIQDVVALPTKIDQSVRDRPGILGTLIAGDRVLVVVDIFGMIDMVLSKLALNAGITNIATVSGNSHSLESFSERHGEHRILIAEDSSFFRNFVRQVLSEAGFKTEVACDGAEAWTMLENAAPHYYSLILSDIEMPIMDGFELAAKISRDPRFKNVPLVAITTRYSSSDIERGRQVGFTRYLEKLNPEKLITALDELLLPSDYRKDVKRASNQ
ncbi:MAG: chemotaxis protein CheW [Oligoflexales bacterium]|nr:chemotaxis protein CheW [Oligoflexales bacterium]